ncbi:MAG: CHAT domain-containing protein, partial [Acidobacteriota bacterium]|nr:CHAT domain-containing protein [Acidobacteriota bacterium]
AGDLRSEGTVLNSIGGDYAQLGEHWKALEYELKALPRLQGEADRRGRAITLYMIGDAYNALHESQKALDYLGQSLAQFDEGAPGRAGVLASMGEVYDGMGDHKTALAKETQALEICRRFGNPATKSKILNDIAITDEWLTGRTDAEKILRDLLASDLKRNDIQQEAATTNNLAELSRFYGDFQDAKTLYERALALNSQVGDKYSRSHTLTGLAATYEALGEGEKALNAMKEALGLVTHLADRAGEAKVLGDLGGLYGDRGEYQIALETYNQALSLVNSAEDPDTQATLLNGIASDYEVLGRFDLAADYYSRALEIHKRLGDEFNEGEVLNNLAVLAQRREARSEALRYYAEALMLTEKTGNKLGQSRLLSSESLIYRDMGDTQRALTNLAHALQLARETGDLDSEALAIVNRGGVRERTGDAPGALADYDQALPLWRKAHAVWGEQATVFVKAKLESKQGDLDGALHDVREAMRLSDSSRGQVGTADLRASLTATSSNFAELEIDLLMRLNTKRPGHGYNTQAFEASERGRARSLVEILRESHLQVDQQVDPELRKQEQSIESSINAKAAEQMKMAGSSEAKAEEQRLESEIQDLRVKYDNVESRIRRKSPAYAALTKPQPLSLKQLQREALDPGSLLLEYSLGEERSYLWAVDPNSFHSYELPKRAEIENAAREYTDLVTSGQNNPAALQQVAAALSAELLAPAAARLKAKRLIIVADGELQRVPFAIVPDPESTSGEPLLVRHEVLSEPSASTVAVDRSLLAGRKAPSKELAVIADPVFQADDERLGKPVAQVTRVERPLLETALRQAGHGQIERLPYTGEEARRILAHTRRKDSLLITGLQASKAEVLAPEISQYRIVHFATHGLLDVDHPELSGLVLSLYNVQREQTDGFLRLNEIYNLKLPAELVVLSACESGKGKLLKGEGVMGLTRGFLYAGARTLVVSLWSVNDASTAELMARFYEAMMGREHLRPAAALRAAQLSMRAEPKWSDPYYWAAFTVQGDWK